MRATLCRPAVGLLVAVLVLPTLVTEVGSHGGYAAPVDLGMNPYWFNGGKAPVRSGSPLSMGRPTGNEGEAVLRGGDLGLGIASGMASSAQATLSVVTFGMVPAPDLCGGPSHAYHNAQVGAFGECYGTVLGFGAQAAAAPGAFAALNRAVVTGSAATSAGAELTLCLVLMACPSPGSGGGRLAPDRSAQGPHTTVRVDRGTGQISHYAEWAPNARNPSGWDLVQRVDVVGDPHFNKVSREYVPTPHVQGPSIPGGVRAAEPWEVPAWRR